MKDCFVGGVMSCGSDNMGSGVRQCRLKWENDYSLRAAYAITYRYGRPEPHAMRINNNEIKWDMTNQAGPEQYEVVDKYFAPHAQDITEKIQILNDTLKIDFPHQNVVYLNDGWWGVYILILYESPGITSKVCSEIYIADQNQIQTQNYNIEFPEHLINTPVLFSIHSGRITTDEFDESQIFINNQNIGKILGGDSIIPTASSGVQGHFYYENQVAQGTNGDIANNNVYGQDGIAVINEYLDTNSNLQSIRLQRVNYSSTGGFNPHPSFNITYTPTCPIPPNANMPRTYPYCYQQSTPRGHADIKDTLSLSAIPNYDHYAWTPGKGLSDSTIANPQCFADSSRWYRVRMWNDDEGEACAQTIPVFVTVNQVPRPGKLEIKPSICPANTGKIVFKNMAGKSPFRYIVNGVQRISNTFEELEPGKYDLMVKDAAGCVWDTTVVIPVSPMQTAAFTANPDSGYSPMKVTFLNQSQLATDYTWLLDGVPFGNQNNKVHTFEEPGTYEVALVAHRLDELCADTAFAFIYVAQGLKLFVPNIITPNNDGRNDALVVQTGGVAHIRWEVHNRWGNLLHKGEATRPPVELTLWSPENNEYPDGVYTVVITAQGESGEVQDFVVQIMVSN